MRMHLPLSLTCLLLLMFVILFPQKVVAADVDWQIEVKEDGTLAERISLPSEQIIPMGDWTVEKQGNNTLYQRVVADWESYEQEKDRLPIKVEQLNYILYKTTKLSSDPDAGGSLIEHLEQMNGVKINIITSGIVRETSGKSDNNYSTEWSFLQSSDLRNEGLLFRVVTIDGFLLGISILFIGVVVVFVIFVSRLKKVDKIIEEIYSLENIQLEDLDELENENIS